MQAKEGLYCANSSVMTRLLITYMASLKLSRRTILGQICKIEVFVRLDEKDLILSSTCNLMVKVQLLQECYSSLFITEWN